MKRVAQITLRLGFMISVFAWSLGCSEQPSSVGFRGVDESEQEDTTRGARSDAAAESQSQGETSADRAPSSEAASGLGTPAEPLTEREPVAASPAPQNR